MKKLLFILGGMTICWNPAQAQPDTLWTMPYGGGCSDEGNCVLQTGDGGYVAVGSSNSYSADSTGDIWLIKVDENGGLQWIRTYGGTMWDEGKSIEETDDGGFIIAGYTNSFTIGDHDVYLVRTDDFGVEKWEKTYGGIYHDYGYNVEQTGDGGFVIAGSRCMTLFGNYDVWLIKTDESGNEEWNKTYGRAGGDHGYEVQPTVDGGYIIVGWTASIGAGGDDVWLIKTDAMGSMEWNQTYGGIYDDKGYSVMQTDGGGYIIAGMRDEGSEDGSDVWLIKVDNEGEVIWERMFDGGEYDGGSSLRLTKDGGYVIAGYFGRDFDTYDLCVIKTDGDGNEQWSQTIGGELNDWGNSIRQTVDSGYIIAGMTESYGAGNYDVWLVRLDADGVLVDGMGENQLGDFTLYPPSPNPFNQRLVISFELKDASEIKLSVYDVLGREIQSLVTGHSSLGKHCVVWNASGVGSGVYFVRLMVDGGWSMERKVVLMK